MQNRYLETETFTYTKITIVLLLSLTKLENSYCDDFTTLGKSWNCWLFQLLATVNCTTPNFFSFNFFEFLKSRNHIKSRVLYQKSGFRNKNTVFLKYYGG